MAEDNNATITLQELQDQVQVLQDAVAATAAAPPGGAPPAPPAATFALVPWPTMLQRASTSALRMGESTSKLEQSL
jgi:hypothetical protein